MLETEPKACWQSTDAYSHLLKMDMAGLAWEWLRRTPQYHLMYDSQTSRQNLRDYDPMPLPGLDADTAATAGLHFL